jgi:hypothetical protein
MLEYFAAPNKNLPPGAFAPFAPLKCALVRMFQKFYLVEVKNKCWKFVISTIIMCLYFIDY